MAFFQSAILHGDTFGSQNNLFVGELLSLVGNGLTAEHRFDTHRCDGCAADTAKVAVSFSDSSILHFLTREGGFSEAANQVFTQRHSLS